MGSCTLTVDSTNYPWWAVDLESERLVRSVVIYNRVDAIPDRLHDLTIGLMSTWPSTGASSVIATDTTCATLDGPQTEARLVILCEKNAVGRYLVVQIAVVNSILTLCEVEVFANQSK
ncbi:hypothetical protein NP493_114g06066 [Ridgeia piscesae]|uniref:Fucolectin tachylectin-4 pentraxin-1 domain-containing protein n=1 Tax=Ridgeia piscesae TaxID=27915 RepID=A0AAD9UHA6_RIDPI|nr:hypothetical protein NP493_114g06065 [Ridgeia piscesae]KAK2189177.1 hypothetical protein NP493_114g06066 [Ridgeia piscesae]